MSKTPEQAQPTGKTSKPSEEVSVALQTKNQSEILKEKLRDVLQTLTDRERKVVQLRFGLGDGYCRTREEVGRQFRTTVEEIAQIEAKALRKLRHPTRQRQIEPFLTGQVKED